MTRPTPSDVRAAAEALPTVVRDTPCIPSSWLSSVAGRDVWLKLETLQPTHSFKVRGAIHAVNVLLARSGAGRLVTASAGNHGAALAWAATRRHVPLTVFTPSGAPAAKLRRISSYGVDLRPVARDYDEAERLALEEARTSGATYVSPYNDPFVLAGASTVGLEVLAQVPRVDEVVVPLGGGGLLSGIALALEPERRRCRLVGAEPAASPAFTTARRHGRITPIEVGATLADGLAGNIEPGSITFPIVRDLVDQVVTVDEKLLRRAIKALAGDEHLIAEGAGAIGAAAVLGGLTRPGAKCTVVVLTGSNIDLATLVPMLAE